MVLARLSTAGMRVNASKSKFFTEQIEYLGYWNTRQGIQPVHNKVEAILHLSPPPLPNKKRIKPIHWCSQLLLQHVILPK
jgi:hypothetical protein